MKQHLLRRALTMLAQWGPNTLEKFEREVIEDLVSAYGVARDEAQMLVKQYASIVRTTYREVCDVGLATDIIAEKAGKPMLDNA